MDSKDGLCKDHLRVEHMEHSAAISERFTAIIAPARISSHISSSIKVANTFSPPQAVVRQVFLAGPTSKQ
jgi:hypothetical protein